MNSKTNRKTALKAVGLSIALAAVSTSAVANANLGNLPMNQNNGLQVRNFGTNYAVNTHHIAMPTNANQQINTNNPYLAINAQVHNPYLAVNNKQATQQQVQRVVHQTNLATNEHLQIRANSKPSPNYNFANYAASQGNPLNSIQYVDINGQTVQRLPIKMANNQSQAIEGQYVKVKRVKIKLPPHNDGAIAQGTEHYYQNVENIVKNNILSDNYKTNSGFNIHKQTGFIRPVNYKINSPYGMRFHPVDKVVKMHTGVDFKAPEGAPIRAVADGVVTMSQFNGGYGNMVLLDHLDDNSKADWSTLYGHASKLAVKVGQVVKQGDIIAYVGSTGKSTGPHLHFEIFKNGQRINPAAVIPDKQI